jgi:hypothetical protein
MAGIGEEIERLRGQRRDRPNVTTDRKIEEKGNVEQREVTKVMRDSGFSDEDMHRWHKQFEKEAPEDHEEFLRFLRIPDDEVKRIREWSRAEK